MELGGTKTILLIAEGERVIDRLTIPTATPQDTLARVRHQLAAWRAVEPISALGIASFGPLQLDPAVAGFGHMLQTPKPGWSGADIVGGVAADLDCPTLLDTDVNGAALAEHCWGAGQGVDTLCYLTVGTGLGGGVLTGGKVLHGAMHPEIGHTRVRRLPGDDFPGACPVHGDCIEGLVCGPALRLRFGRPMAEVPDDDPRWAHVAADLSELAATLLLTLSARLVLFGGGVSTARPFLLPLIRRNVLERLGGYLAVVTEETVDDIIRAPGLGQDAGPMGALALALRALDGA